MQFHLKSSQDFFAGALFIGISALVFFTAGSLEMGTSARMGAGYAPRLLACILFLTGALLAFRGITLDGPRTETWNYRPLFFVLGAIAVFALLLERAGFILTAFVVIAMSSFATRDSRPRELLILAVAVTAGCSAVFIYGLKLLIPLWPQF